MCSHYTAKKAESLINMFVYVKAFRSGNEVLSAVVGLPSFITRGLSGSMEELLMLVGVETPMVGGNIIC